MTTNFFIAFETSISSNITCNLYISLGVRRCAYVCVHVWMWMCGVFVCVYVYVSTCANINICVLCACVSLCECVCAVCPYKFTHVGGKKTLQKCGLLFMHVSYVATIFIASHNSQIIFRKLNINTHPFKYAKIDSLFSEVKAGVDEENLSLFSRTLTCSVGFYIVCFLLAVSANVIHHILF